MAVLTDVVLVADGGDITAGRKTSTLTFGEFNVVLPEDVQQRDERDGRIKDGYVYRPDGEFAPFDIGFARADVTVDLQAKTSDLESVVDAAQSQADGDVFFERDITIVGLGGFVPGVDFQVGDIVTVELWGGLVRLALPVTDITLISSDSEGVIAWRVHVGGMLISDLAELRRSNEELRRQVKSDGRSISQARSDASSAKSTADDAQRVAGDTMRAVVGAEGVIQRSLAASAASVAQGHVFAQEAYESYEKAQESYVSALSALDEMERLLGESDAVLRENEQLARDIKNIHSQVSVLGAQVRVASQQMGALLGSVSGNVALSLQYSEEAREAVDDAAELRRQVEGLVVEAEAAITEGRQHVQSALSHSKSAAQAVLDAQAQARKAKAEADRAIQTLDDVKSVKAGADSAAKAAGERLADLQREAEDALSKIDAKQNEILALHQEVLEKHGEVLTAHETAIRAVAEGVKAAGAAAGSAAMGAMWAQLTAEDAARAAESALDAAQKNEEAIRLLAEAQEKLEEASKKLAAANDENAKAIDTLKEAQKLQDKINQDLVAADEKLTEAQRKLEAQTANLKKAVELTNQAVRAVGAAAGFAAQTGMHAADVGERATRTAESALEAYAHLQEVVEIHGDVVTKASKTATDAKNAADAAAEAGRARDAAIAKIERTAARIVYMTSEAGISNVSTNWLRLEKSGDGVVITPRTGWRGYVVMEQQENFRLNGATQDESNRRFVLWVESGKIWRTNGQTANGGPAVTANSGKSKWSTEDLIWIGEYDERRWSVLCTVYPYE